jgi:hypothetical protein|tara:strand:+ start:518 stop:1321 length:804 start_codon:yes stop_codon:yes gene_type:complete
MYRLIWFQHVHKAAGSLIVNQAIANGEVLFKNHKNGNPYTPEGELTPLWEFDKDLLTAFVDQCEAEGVTFVATEWGAPIYEVLHSDPRVVLVTCLREPWSRFISNFNYDYYHGFTKSRTLGEFLSEELRIKQDNFLVRVFSRNYSAPEGQLDEISLSTAFSNLHLFDLVLVTERQYDLSNHLFEALGWQSKPVFSHTTFGNLWLLKSLVGRLRLYTAWKYLLRRKIGISEKEKKQFLNSSHLDLILYDRLMIEEIRGFLHPLNPTSH